MISARKVADSATNKRRLPRWAKVVMGVVFVLAVIVLGPHAYFAIRIHQELAAIRVEGWPTTPSEMVKWPPVVRAERAAQIFGDAVSRVNWTDGALSDKFLREGLPSADGTGASDQIRVFATECLRANAEALLLLRQAVAAEESSQAVPTPAKETKPVSLYTAQKVFCLLGMEAVQRAEKADSDGAAEAMITTFRAIYSLRGWPGENSRMAYSESTERGLSDLERVLSCLAFSERDTKTLDAILLRAEDQDGLTAAFAADRCTYHHLADNTDIYRTVGVTSRCPLAIVWNVYRLTPLMAADRLANLQERLALVKMSQKPLPLRLKAHETWRVSRRENWSDKLFNFAFRSSGVAVPIDAECVAHLRAARTALAIDRFRNARGKLPETLDSLVPDFLDAVPQDPFDGKPLRYKPLDKGYVLHSVGSDGVDNDGRPVTAHDSIYVYWRDGDITFTVAR
jgi:hypothetical protein